MLHRFDLWLCIQNCIFIRRKIRVLVWVGAKVLTKIGAATCYLLKMENRLIINILSEISCKEIRTNWFMIRNLVMIQNLN